MVSAQRTPPGAVVSLSVEGRQDALAGHPDRERWNARYAACEPAFSPHPLAERALEMTLPEGPVADLACGASGSALLAAGRGRRVTAVDVSEKALRLLADEAERRGLDGLLTLVHADLATWRPGPGVYALVICTGYWDRALFEAACGAVRAGGVLAWEAFTQEARASRPHLPASWCLGAGEPATLLPAGYEVLCQRDVTGVGRGGKRRMLARAPGSAAESPADG